MVVLGDGPEGSDHVPSLSCTSQIISSRKMAARQKRKKILRFPHFGIMVQ